MTNVSSPNPQAQFDQFARANGFTLEYLAANRMGQIHPGQVALGRRRSGYGCSVFLLLIALAVFGGAEVKAIMDYQALRPPIPAFNLKQVYIIAVGGAFIALVPLGLAALTMWRVTSARKVYAQGRPFVVEGPLHKVKVKHGPGNYSYRYRIGTANLDVPRPGWELARHGARYRVYFVTDHLLSMEPI